VDIIYKEENTLGFILYQADLKIKNNLLRRIKSFAINTEQWGIMNILYEEDGINQKELAARSLKDQAALTRTLDKLQNRGLIIRQVSPSDRRAFLIFLTDEGKELRKKIEPIAIECLEAAVKGFTSGEISTLKTLLRRVTANLE